MRGKQTKHEGLVRSRVIQGGSFRNTRALLLLGAKGIEMQRDMDLCKGKTLSVAERKSREKKSVIALFVNSDSNK